MQIGLNHEQKGFFLESLDPYNQQRITFSDIIRLLSTQKTVNNNNDDLNDDNDHDDDDFEQTDNPDKKNEVVDFIKHDKKHFLTEENELSRAERENLSHAVMPHT